MAAYVAAVEAEIGASRRVNAAPLTSVFFGGGTPSLVPPALVGRLIDALRARFGIAPGAEISMEADPGTFDAPRLREYAALGVDRVSVGVQAFQQSALEACGRSHSLSDVHAALADVRAAGLRSWSLDLMGALPHLTRDDWRRSLAAAIDAGPHHVSVYDLQVEEGTPFARWYRPGAAPLPADDAAAGMFEDASAALRAAGYEHYELSNYAKPGHRCAHNQVYWAGGGYYAFGVGAASYLAGRRFSRPKGLAGYYAWSEGYAAAGAAAGAAGSVHAGALGGEEQPPEAPEERLLDTVMLRLRLRDGLDLARLEAEHGAEAAGTVRAALAAYRLPGAVEGLTAGGGPCAVADASVVRLSDPQGLLLSNDIISDVFAAFELPAAVTPAAG
jgi:oxygen-independent coproporphyrinogen-3 oxidase